MGCLKCGKLRILDPDRFLLCPNCDNYCYMYSQEETIKKIQNQLKDRINAFFHYINNFNLREVVLKLHDYRNTLNPQEIFFFKYFSTSFGIGQILKHWNRINKPKQSPLNQESLEYIISMIQEIYLDYHHKYFTKFDAVRLVKMYSNNTEGFKYTENWLPYLRRAILSGSTPKDGYFHSKEGISLFSAKMYKDILINQLITQNPKYEDISTALILLQNYLFHYPWKDYLNVGHDETKINDFLNVCSFLEKKEILLKIEIINLSVNIKKNLIEKFISKPQNSINFPLIIKLNKNWYIPNKLFSMVKKFYILYSSKGRRELRKFQSDLGEVLEDRLFNEIQNFKLDFKAPRGQEQKLLRYKDPKDTGVEIFDIGALNHKLKIFYVIECKNKSYLKLRDFDPRKLNDYIIEEFNKFRDRDIPRIKELMIEWGIDNYKVKPIFFNIVPLQGEIVEKDLFAMKDRINIAQSHEEINTIIRSDFMDYTKSLFDIYNLPDKFIRLIGDETLKDKVNINIPQDLGNLIGELKERYLIVNGTLKQIDELTGDIDILLDDPPLIIIPETPPNLMDKIKTLKMKKGDRVSAFIYRRYPNSPLIFLGNIWKIY